MKLTTTLLAVADIERSKKFYSDLFGQEVTLDLGENVSFSGGFAIQQDFARLTGVPEASVVRQSNNMELYFEVDDFDTFAARLASRDDIIYVHPLRKHAWHQRVIRMYDPDGHMIEIGESMREIACRFSGDGLPVEEIARLMHCPISYIEELLSV